MSNPVLMPDVYIVFFHEIDVRTPDAQPIVAGEICAVFESEELALAAIASKRGGSPKTGYFVRKYMAVNPYLKEEPEVVVSIPITEASTAPVLVQIDADKCRFEVEWAADFEGATPPLVNFVLYAVDDDGGYSEINRMFIRIDQPLDHYTISTAAGIMKMQARSAGLL